MYYSLIHYPQADLSKLKSFKKKYDPYDKLLGPHITLIFPIHESIGKIQLKDHINKVLYSWKPFKIHVKGIDKAWDHWLYLIFDEGKDNLIKLHDELYGGILSSYLRKDIKFIPHISIGFFGDSSRYDLKNPTKTTFNKHLFDKALEEANASNFNFEIVLNKLTLITLDDKFTQILESKDFPFVFS